MKSLVFKTKFKISLHFYKLIKCDLMTLCNIYALLTPLSRGEFDRASTKSLVFKTKFKISLHFYKLIKCHLMTLCNIYALLTPLLRGVGGVFYFNYSNFASKRIEKCFNIFAFTSSSSTFSTPSSTFKEVTALPRMPQGIILSK
jgi:hypothetical protein